jgi:hypothetical protein
MTFEMAELLWVCKSPQIRTPICVWVNSQVLPTAFVEQLAADPLDAATCFLFNHVSSRPYAPQTLTSLADHR